MGNKIGRLHLIRHSKQKKRQPVSKPQNEENRGAENLAESSVEEEFPTENQVESQGQKEFPTENSAAENLVESPVEEEFPTEKSAAEHMVESPCEEDFPTENLAHSWDDDNSIAERMAELSDWIESPVENREAGASGPAENIESDVMDKSSKDPTDILQEILATISHPKENVPLKYLKEILDDEDRKALDLLMKVSKELKNISVPSSAWKNLMELLVNGEYISENPEATSGFQNITAESLFSLSVYGIDCYHSNDESKCENENLKFCEYVAPLLHEEGLSCLNVTRYNSERNRILEITLICREITSGVTKFVLYLWDSKDDKWRLVTSPSIEVDSTRSFAPPDVRAKGIYYTKQRATSCTFKCLSQSTPSADLPIHIKQSLESETRLTAYNGYLEKKLDVTLAQGKKHEHETEFYIEWTGNKKAAYSFTAPNDAEPTGQ